MSRLLDNLAGAYRSICALSIKKLYNRRASGKYIQIHNPLKFVIAFIMPDKDIDLDKDIIELEDNTNKIINNSDV